MKTILVPTDFSKNAENALYYAIELAKKEDAKLILLNVYENDYATSYVPYGLIADEIAKAKKESGIQLKALSLKIEHAGNIRHASISIEGAVIDTILTIIKQQEISLVVMGTKSSPGITGAIFGSIAAKIIEKATCPVIAVPEETGFTSIKKITYATAYNPDDLANLKEVVLIARAFRAQLHVLHISDNSFSEESEEIAMKKFMGQVTAAVHYNNMSFQVLYGNTIEGTLEKYLDENSTSMLVMSTHYRNFFDKVFGKSTTRNVARHAKIPLMAFHHKETPVITIF